MGTEEGHPSILPPLLPGLELLALGIAEDVLVGEDPNLLLGCELGEPVNVSVTVCEAQPEGVEVGPPPPASQFPSVSSTAA